MNTQDNSVNISDDSSDASPSPSPTHSLSSAHRCDAPSQHHASFAAARLAARTGRTRTISESERIMAGPTYKGTVTEFCRSKGHGYIEPDDGGEHVFLHISDIEGDFVPKPGDIVTYKRFPIPPRKTQFSAAHVQIVKLNESVAHEKWDAPNIVPPVASGDHCHIEKS